MFSSRRRGAALVASINSHSLGGVPAVTPHWGFILKPFSPWVREALGGPWHPPSIRRQNRGSWWQWGGPQGCPSDVAQLFSTTPLPMACTILKWSSFVLFLFLKKIKYLKLAWSHTASEQQSQDLNLFCQAHTAMQHYHSKGHRFFFSFYYLKYILMKIFQKEIIYFQRFKNREN